MKTTRYTMPKLVHRVMVNPGDLIEFRQSEDGPLTRGVAYGTDGLYAYIGTARIPVQMPEQVLVISPGQEV